MSRLHRTVHDQFVACADRIAVAGVDVSYAGLRGLVSGLQGVMGPEAKAVGILSTRRLEAYVAVLACFFGGIKFVPMNPELPVSRLQHVAEAGEVELVLCDPSTAALAGEIGTAALNLAEVGEGAEPIHVVEVRQDATAYQMFTSGSTGTPKGVPITYGNLEHYVTQIIAALELPKGARFSQLFDLSFDLAMHDIFVTFASGGCLVPASGLDLIMPHGYLAKNKIDVWFSVPMLAMVAQRGQGQKPVDHQLQMALFCGEPLPTEYAQNFKAFLADEGALYNLYGPTEATIAFTVKRFDPNQSQFATVPLGAPFGGNLIAVETETGDVVALREGVTGELLLGGPQVFSGYRPANAVECFVSAEGQRYYRSGDLVRVEKGELLHLGRKDSQIKLRGYRIELGDVEAVFRKVFDCPSTAAIVLGTGEDKQIGVAYVRERPVDDLKPLSGHLPGYMMPGALMHLEAMPTNVNGKIDRKHLEGLSWSA
ncbi:MAG: AMP-binding protein [Pseudomonadota bacterium]